MAFFVLILMLISPAYAGTSSTADNAYQKALQMTATLENSETSLQYNYAENIKDNRGITFGIVGFTTGTEDGNKLIKYYTTLNPNNNLEKYISALDKIDAGSHSYNGGDSNPDVTGLDGFIADVENNNDPLWKTAQLYEVEQMYWNPAVTAWNTIGANNELTLAFLYDANVRHGEDGMQSVIDGATSACKGTPATGIDEKTFLAAMFTTRDSMLANEKDTDDKTRDDGFKTVLSSGNVNLNTPYSFTAYDESFIIDGNVGVNTPSPVTPVIPSTPVTPTPTPTPTPIPTPTPTPIPTPTPTVPIAPIKPIVPIVPTASSAPIPFQQPLPVVTTIVSPTAVTGQPLLFVLGQANTQSQSSTLVAFLTRNI